MSSAVAARTQVATDTLPSLNIGTLDDRIPGRRTFLSLPLSFGIHLAVVLGLVVVPALTPMEFPDPPAVHAFLIEPTSIAPPPPPPPPPPAQSSLSRHPDPKPQLPSAFVAPIETPASLPDSQGLDVGAEGGVAGGVEGGVEGGVVGGVVGGIIGGLPSAAAPVAPIRVGGDIKAPRKIKDVAPEYPGLAVRARVSGVVILEAVIGADGKVKDAKVLKGIPMLDEAALKAVRQWAYTPTLLGGVPVPVVMSVTVTFDLSS